MYTNATFHLDYDLGSDAARTTLADVVFSNPSADVVLGTKVAHGLVSGAVITVSGCGAAYANDVWKITRIDNDTFTVDSASWVSWNDADVTGDVVPFGGQSWADAWKTIGAGATAARIAPGDIIKIAKSPAPVSIGDAEWTNKSKTVTLATAQNLTVDLCETAYTAATGLITALNAAPTAGGSGYAINDTFYITTGGNGAIGKVTAVSGTVVTGVVIVSGGNGIYTTGTGKATTKITGGGNDALTVNITTVAVAVVTRTAVATDGKEGAFCMKITAPTNVKLGTKLAYYAINPGSLAGYQKLSFWIKNSAAITAGQWRVCLCSDASGETVVDEFLVPAIASTAKWLPLTITKTGGGNMGAATASIAIYADTVAPASASNIIVDDFVACTTAGLNLQSLISKNSVEKEGAEPWLAIQSINNGVILLDNITDTKANAGQGYSGASDADAATYKRETTKTDIQTGNTTTNEVQDSGTDGNNIQFLGGYNPADGNQDGETFFDGLNGNGFGVYLSSKSYITLNHINGCRNNYALYFLTSTYNTITNISNANNNTSGVVFSTNSDHNTLTALLNANNCSWAGLYFLTNSCNNTVTAVGNVNSSVKYGVYFTGSCNNNLITTISNANNNLEYGVAFATSCKNTITTLSNANDNTTYAGVAFFAGSDNNLITTLSNANNNTTYGVYFLSCSDNVIKTLSTTGNVIAAVCNTAGRNYIYSATLAEDTKVTGMIDYADGRVICPKYSGAYSHIFTDGGDITSLETDRVGGTGQMWKLAITSANRSSGYPLYLTIAKIAVVSGKLVTVKAYMKKSHETNVVAKLVCRAGQLTGVDLEAATKANDLDWQELTITFTPSEAGVIEIEAWGYYSAAAGDVYVEDLSINQAA